jgi:alpha-tubulin suppressor-like RCC1 family protein
LYYSPHAAVVAVILLALAAQGVVLGGGATSGVVQAISLTPTSASAHWGKTIQLTAQATDAAAVAVTGQTINYASSDTNIATVSNTGLVTLINPGTVNITATSGSVTSNASVINAKGFAAGTVAVYNEDNCAIDDTKTEVLCWGDGYPITPNLPLELQYPSPMKLKPGQVPAGTTIASVAPGFYHSCLLTTAGDVYCWAGAASSANDFLAMGTNGALPTSEPALVLRGEMPVGVKVTKLFNGSYSTCVLADDGNVYCWGRKSAFPKPATATSTNTYFSSPVKMGVSVAGVKFVDYATYVGGGCGISDLGQLYCAGASAYLTPQTHVASELPANVKLTKIKAEAGEGGFMMVLGDDGWTYSVGSGSGRRFGNGTTAFVGGSDSTKLIRTGQGAIPAGEKIVDFSPGGIASSNCVVTTAGKAYCWSASFYGSAGDGDLSNHDILTPKLVVQGQLPAAVKFASIGCGRYHCSALGTDRKVYAWGYSQSAAIGGTTSVAVPTLINKVGN